MGRMGRMGLMGRMRPTSLISPIFFGFIFIHFDLITSFSKGSIAGNPLC